MLHQSPFNISGRVWCLWSGTKYGDFPSWSGCRSRVLIQYLRDDGELGAEVVQAYRGDLHVVDGDLSLRRLQQPEEAQRHGRLAGSSATDDTDLGGKIQID